MGSTPIGLPWLAALGSTQAGQRSMATLVWPVSHLRYLLGIQIEMIGRQLNKQV